MIPKPASVRYNDWSQVAVEPLDTFMPAMPVSIIIPYYQTPAETLDRTLATLERQTYPRELFEVIIVDDGSEPPLEPPIPTPLNVKVARQERRGFGLARARNTGARAAAHNILLFLDSDIMAEAAWIAAHARWHHAVSDAITFGPLIFVSVEGVNADILRRHKGSLEELFSDRPADPTNLENRKLIASRAESKADALFRIMMGGNFGIRKEFYWSVGGHDESFTRYGAEDTEFSYRAYTAGGLLVPSLDACVWHHQELPEEESDKAQSIRLQSGKVAHLIAHPDFRVSSPGRIFTAPQYVVTIEDAGGPLDDVLRAAVNILADRAHDLVVRIETDVSGDDERLARLRDELGPDPRVRVAPTRSALDEFPASPFHITIPAGVVFRRGLVHRLRARLGDAAIAVSTLPNGSALSLTRAWALHRARRAGGSPAHFGDTKTIRPASLKLKQARPSVGVEPKVWTAPLTPRERLLNRARGIRGPREAWLFLKWLAEVAHRRWLTRYRTRRWHLRRRNRA